MKVLGVDPSLRSTGFGVLEVNGSRLSAICQGHISNSSRLLPSRCLVRIGDALGSIIKQHLPDVLAVEGLVYVQNTRISLSLGQVRGVAIAIAAQYGLEIYEYAPRRVKQAVTGLGGAGKTKVSQMIKTVLSLADMPQEDAADALAIAICHVYCMQSVQVNPPKQI